MGKSTNFYGHFQLLPEGMNVFLFQVYIVRGGNNRCVWVFNLDFLNIRIDGGHPRIIIGNYVHRAWTSCVFFDNIE